MRCRHELQVPPTRLELGNVTIKVLHTPGHTPEHISLVVTDHTRSEDPWFVLTGHTLMVGDLGRTELATSAEEGARNLFASVQRLKALPDHLVFRAGASYFRFTPNCGHIAAPHEVTRWGNRPAACG